MPIHIVYTFVCAECQCAVTEQLEFRASSSMKKGTIGADMVFPPKMELPKMWGTTLNEVYCPACYDAEAAQAVEALRRAGEERVRGISMASSVGFSVSIVADSPWR